jgi:hypothetical protein
MDKTIVGIILLTVIVFGGITWTGFQSNKNFKPARECVEHSAALAMHIHPVLSITIDGQSQPVPANIGVEPNCMRAIHTHDDTGKIHVEYPENYDFKLSDFFSVWQQPFSQTEILDKKVDGTHTLTMTVDGKPSTEFGNLLLKDNQQIAIHYDTKK